MIPRHSTELEQHECEFPEPIVNSAGECVYTVCDECREVKLRLYDVEPTSSFDELVSAWVFDFGGKR